MRDVCLAVRLRLVETTEIAQYYDVIKIYDINC